MELLLSKTKDENRLSKKLECLIVDRIDVGRDLAQRVGLAGIVEKSEYSRAAARHRGVEGPGGQQLFLGGADGRPGGENRRFEVVGDDSLPCLLYTSPSPRDP